MPWAKLSDDAANHRKARYLRVKDPLEGLAAWGWWGAALCYCAKNQTDGFIPATDLHMVADDVPMAVVMPLVEQLVLHHLLDPHTHPEKGKGWLVHDYLIHNPTKEEYETKKRKDKQRQALARDKVLQARVRERDRNRCRYCQRAVRWKSKGVLGGTFDHVDPHGETTFDNLVVACNECNASKSDGPRPGAKITPALIERVLAELAGERPRRVRENRDVPVRVGYGSGREPRRLGDVAMDKPPAVQPQPPPSVSPPVRPRVEGGNGHIPRRSTRVAAPPSPLVQR